MFLINLYLLLSLHKKQVLPSVGTYPDATIFSSIKGRISVGGSLFNPNQSFHKDYKRKWKKCFVPSKAYDTKSTNIKKDK